ncbi:MAG: helix-turn-helix transcriptional regulator [Oscillospiraceae bacterium]|nr:helix-turn-helix transcriptional regulator [Oscillospiraceae bacterium]MBQ6902863.1 helix-turn-helix transcriptional regulator [Oscillospiraceae bacterium]
MDKHFRIESTAVLEKLPISISTLCFRSLENDLHIHTYTHIAFVLAGSANGSVKDKEYSFPPYSCAIAAPYTLHSFDTRCSEDTPIVVHIRFKDSFLTERGYRFFHYNNTLRFEERTIPEFIVFNDENKAEAKRIIRALTTEFENKENMSFDRIAEYLAEFFRMVATASPQEPVPVFKKEAINCIENAVKYIEAHYAEKLTIDDVIPLTAMSRSIFTKQFKAITGMTFVQFLTSIRFGHVIPMLVATEMSLNEIAAKTGLYNKTNLVRTFTKYFGMSPMRFRDYFEETSPGVKERHLTYKRRWKWLDDAEEGQVE